ncbi:MAG: hypothetical protein KZQ97_13895 [Candidatus Thiodiazotropha sp. (ex Dulcina madagascariensis)]|nr:hypothetical protein [Candidatus Thiodiazotropha sp. (ex Dulcina madagascariensis)]
MNKYIFHVIGVIATFLILLLLLSIYQIHIYQIKSMEFWGELYDEKDKLVLGQGWLQPILIAQQGPLINPSLITGCNTDYLQMVPLVPFRPNKETIDVLCGYGTGSFIITSSLQNDPDLKKFVLKQGVIHEKPHK